MDYVPEDIQDICEELGIDWYGNQSFQHMCMSIVGKPDIENMTSNELGKIYVRLLRGERPREGRYAKVRRTECKMMSIRKLFDIKNN